MECPREALLLEAYIDGELDTGQRAELETHLKICSECYGRVRTVVSLKKAIADLQSALKCPESLKRRVIRALGEQVTGHDYCSESSVYAYLDGDCSDELRSGIESALEQDEEVRRKLEFAKGFKRLIRTAQPVIGPSESLRQRILNALEAETPSVVSLTDRTYKGRYKKRWRFYRPVWAAAVVALVFLSVLGTMFRTPSQASPLIGALGMDHRRCCTVTTCSGIGKDPVMMAEKYLGRRPKLVKLPSRLVVYDHRVCSLPADTYPGTVLHILSRDLEHKGLQVSFFAAPYDEPGVPSQEGKVIHPVVCKTAGLDVAAWRREGWVYAVVAEATPGYVSDLIKASHYAWENEVRILSGIDAFKRYHLWPRSMSKDVVWF